MLSRLLPNWMLPRSSAAAFPLGAFGCYMFMSEPRDWPTTLLAWLRCWPGPPAIGEVLSKPLFASNCLASSIKSSIEGTTTSSAILDLRLSSEFCSSMTAGRPLIFACEPEDVR